MDAIEAKQAVNILLVDDQPAKLLSYETILADLGENLIRASSGDEALGHLLKTDVAVVLVDVCMPGLDGFELAAMIRQHPRLQRTAIILVSGVLVEDAHRLRGYVSGAVDYVSVPIIPEILRAKVSVFAERFRKTEELERLNRDLEQRVAERTREIEASALRLRQNEDYLRQALERAEQARAEAEAANRLKDQFLAVLSHELRSPLSAILGWAHVLDGANVDAATLAKAVYTIRRNAQLQTRLISDILDVSSILAGKLRLELEAVDLKSVIDTALDTLRPLAEAKRVQVAAELGGGAISLTGDPARLQQIARNVLHNAIQFAPEGSRLDLRAEATKDAVKISVRDEGPGIPPEFLPYVFDRFRQADSSSTREHRGLGLGLAIVKHLVELHGGTVEAVNRGDRSGAMFTIVLPRETKGTARVDVSSEVPLSPPAAGAWRNAAPRLHGTRVLVVDDAADARDLFVEVLRRCGAETSFAASAAEALAIVERERPDVVLADIEMPGEDGYGLLSKIRALPAERGGNVPVAALTAYATAQDRADVLAAGFAAYVSKPVLPLDLARVVGRLGKKP
jgi:signal transduction histidine kinase